MNAIDTQLRDLDRLGADPMTYGIDKLMDAAAEVGRNPVSKHQIQPEYGDEQADAGRDCRTLSRETIFSGANGDIEILFFSVQLTMSTTGNLTRLVHALAICV